MAQQQEMPSVYEKQEYDDLSGGKQRSRPGRGPNEKSYDRVRDAHGNLVSDKPANQGILSGQRARLAHERLVAEQEAARRARKASRAPTTPGNGSNIIRTLFVIAVFLPLLSSFLTGSQSYTFHLSPYVMPPVRKWWRGSSWNPSRIAAREFSPLQLSQYDGSNPNKPLYLAIDGEVFDVSANRRMYGPGGGYSTMAGKDASRSFITGCFKEHQTHDLRGLSPDDLKALDGWKAFFNKHEKYVHVGKVRNRPIDPSTPIPEPCDGDASSLGQAARDRGEQETGHGVGHRHGQTQGQNHARGGVKTGAPPVKRP